MRYLAEISNGVYIESDELKAVYRAARREVRDGAFYDRMTTKAKIVDTYTKTTVAYLTGYYTDPNILGRYVVMCMRRV